MPLLVAVLVETGLPKAVILRHVICVCRCHNCSSFETYFHWRFPRIYVFAILLGVKIELTVPLPQNYQALHDLHTKSDRKKLTAKKKNIFCCKSEWKTPVRIKEGKNWNCSKIFLRCSTQEAIVSQWVKSYS